MRRHGGYLLIIIIIALHYIKANSQCIKWQVGSAAVQPAQDGTGDVNLYVPAYELNKVMNIYKHW